jgi:hypothetical protein
VAVFAPAVTVTLAPTCAAALLLVSVTSAPPAGAAPLNVTVPVDELPPTTVAGLNEADVTVTGFAVAGFTVTTAQADSLESATLVAVSL